MAKQMAGRIRHVALSVQDPWEAAEFYKQALGLEEVTELDGALAEGVFLTDGVVNPQQRAPPSRRARRSRP
jgi:catechol 2,3-dioxygenase-like lactoylglutathione lyase family enzyme